jgi:hypothetical protein
MPGSKVFFRIYFALGGIYFALCGILQLHGLADEQSMAWLAVLPRGQNFGRKTY